MSDIESKQKHRKRMNGQYRDHRIGSVEAQQRPTEHLLYTWLGVAGKISRGKPRQRWEKDITVHGYVWYDDSSIQSGGGPASVSQ